MASLAINQRELPFLPQSGWIQNIWGDIGGQWHKFLYTIQTWLYLLILVRIVFYFKKNITADQKVLKLEKEKKLSMWLHRNTFTYPFVATYNKHLLSVPYVSDIVLYPRDTKMFLSPSF